MLCKYIRGRALDYATLLASVTILKLKPGAMAIKKKIKRIRQAKQNDSESTLDSTDKELFQTDATEDVSKGTE